MISGIVLDRGREQVVGEQHQVGVLPDGDGAPVALAEVGEGAAPGVRTHGRRQVDGLLGHPGGTAAESLPGHRRVEAEQRDPSPRRSQSLENARVAPVSCRLRIGQALAHRRSPTASARSWPGPAMSGLQCRGCMQATTPSSANRPTSAGSRHSTWTTWCRASRGPLRRRASCIASSTVRIPRSPVACTNSWKPAGVQPGHQVGELVRLVVGASGVVRLSLVGLQHRGGPGLDDVVDVELERADAEDVVVVRLRELGELLQVGGGGAARMEERGDEPGPQPPLVPGAQEQGEIVHRVLRLDHGGDARPGREVQAVDQPGVLPIQTRPRQAEGAEGGQAVPGQSTHGEVVDEAVGLAVLHHGDPERQGGVVPVDPEPLHRRGAEPQRVHVEERTAAGRPSVSRSRSAALPEWLGSAV